MMKSLLLLCFYTCFFSAAIAQTHLLLKDIGTDNENGIPQTNESTTWNGVDYFIGFDANSFANDIWSTDGTSVNTKRVVPSNYPEIFFLTSVEKGLLFNAWVGTNRELYVSDGTPGGTQMIADFPGQEVIFLEALNDSIAIFVTRDFVSDITSLWSTNGTSGGTVHLGEYEMSKGFIRFSFYNGSMIITEKRISTSLFPPVITNGTLEGTMFVIDYLNEFITPDLNSVASAVGANDHLFVQTSSGGKVFDGSTLNSFPLDGFYFHGFKLGQQYIIFSDLAVASYNSSNEVFTEISFDNEYFSEPVSSGSKVYFHDLDSYIYETDGTISNTRKISAVSAGFSNLKPYIYTNAKNDDLIYNVVEDNMTSLRIINLSTGLDSVFSIIRPSGTSNFAPHIFHSGNHIIYTRATAEEGREYWSYTPLETGIIKIPEIEELVSYPNPAKNELMIEGGCHVQSGNRVQMVSMAGQQMPVNVVKNQPLTIDISAIPGGFYWIRIQDDSGLTYRSSFVKQ